LYDQVAASLLSFAVNKNIPVAVKALQRVLGVRVDGVLGLVTIATLNQKDPKAIVDMFRAEWINYYHNIVAFNPDNAKFLDGWINRANFPFPSSLVSHIIYG
jgi:lysozyme family protein